MFLRILPLAVCLGLLLVSCGSEPSPTRPDPGSANLGVPAVPCDPPHWIVYGGGDLTGRGELCVDGWVRLRGEVQPRSEGGPRLGRACDLDLATGDPDLRMPVFFTEPEYYPGATYYFAVYTNVFEPGFLVFNAFGDILDEVALQDVTEIRNGRPVVHFRGDDLARYFDPEVGLFRPLPGDSTVVVNFAEVPSGSGFLIPNPAGFVDIEISSRHGEAPFGATLVNAHYQGGGFDVQDRTLSRNWEGGAIRVEGPLRLEPGIGLAMIAKTVGWEHGPVEFGTRDHPALLASMGNVEARGGATLTGSLVFLGTLDLRNRLYVTYEPGLGSSLPPYLQFVGCP